MARRPRLDYAGDAAEVAHIVDGGGGIREIQRQTGWTYHRAREAYRWLTEHHEDAEKCWLLEPDTAERLADKKSRKAKKSAKKKRVYRDTHKAKKPQKPEKAPKEKKKPPRISDLPVIDAKLRLGKVHRFLITAAQDDTPVHESFWNNLQAYACFLDADILVGAYTYQLGLFEDHAAAANVYDASIAPYVCSERVQLTKDLLLLGNANVLPTTANPLNGWLTANKGGHVIVPHSRIALESIPRMASQPPRYAFTTGCCTKPNYTPRAAGQKSLFHHTIGAVLVEIDVDGEIFPRHLVATDDGSFQDLDVVVTGGQVITGRRVRSILWADMHEEQMDPVIAMASWGWDVKARRKTSEDNLLDGTQPEFQFIEDLNDFRRRNHHDIRDPHQRVRVLRDSGGNVEQEVGNATQFVNALQRDWCRTVVVESNHDSALAKWLKDPDGQTDAENAYYWHMLNWRWHSALRAGDDAYNVVEDAMRLGGLGDGVEFVPSGGSFMVDGVECGLHGDLGIGGSRGSPQQYRRLGPKVSSGHTHSPKIVDGVYVAGVSARLQQGYNKGPTTWAHGHVIQYHNGKRALILLSADGRFRAMGDRSFAVWDGIAEAA